MEQRATNQKGGFSFSLRWPVSFVISPVSLSLLILLDLKSNRTLSISENFIFENEVKCNTFLSIPMELRQCTDNQTYNGKVEGCY